MAMERSPMYVSVSRVGERTNERLARIGRLLIRAGGEIDVDKALD
jgi:hypothetical protein